MTRIFVFIALLCCLEADAANSRDEEREIPEESSVPPNAPMSDFVALIKPTVFLVYRDGTKPWNSDWVQLIEIIDETHSLDGQQRFSKAFDNILIIDEGRYWAIVYVVYGNGGVSLDGGTTSYAELTPTYFSNPNRIFYIDKTTLQETERPSDGFLWAPLVGETLNHNKTEPSGSPEE